MNTYYRLLALLLLAASVFDGCVMVRAPLVSDKEYPRDWGDLSALGPECKSLEGTYMNDGVVTGIDGSTQSVSLTSVLNNRSEARIVSLSIRTRKVDQNGDAFITLRVVPDGNTAAFQELEGCFCIKQTLACTQVYETYWSIPNFGLGGAQRNVYFSMTRDRSLIAKVQDYHADVILAIPVFGIKEPWARFKTADQ
jgi:hypothetical protein